EPDAHPRRAAGTGASAGADPLDVCLVHHESKC
ncbi:MAG: hypothetical protein AVDCRST_MAG26-896, partial [uncultured Chloroflexia bacterium]